jgi:competence protein ComEA
VPDLTLSESLSERIESLLGKRRDLWPVLVVVSGVLALVLFLQVRTPPPRIAPPATTPVPEASSSADPVSGELFVHVAGAVRKPGLYAFPDGTRVADAIEAAGGGTASADLDAVNLAELLVDGVKIEVPKRGGPNPSIPTAPPTVAASPTIVNLNAADGPTLETIPGIGPVLATAILQHRDENGPFASVDALLDVSGIGPATLESIRPYVSV